jgi:hypothetical protein
MTRFLTIVCAALLLISDLCPLTSVQASDAVEPASVSITSLRGEAITAASQSYFMEGSTLRLTNSVLYSGTTTNSARQGLTDVSIELRVGNLTTNVPYSGSVASATNGTWWCDIIVPTNMSAIYLQVKLTDVYTNVYYYPWKVLNTSEPMD